MVFAENLSCEFCRGESCDFQAGFLRFGLLFLVQGLNLFADCDFRVLLWFDWRFFVGCLHLLSAGCWRFFDQALGDAEAAGTPQFSVGSAVRQSGLPLANFLKNSSSLKLS